MANKTSTSDLTNELEEGVKQSKKLLKIFEDLESVTKELAKDLEGTFKSIDKNSSKGITEFNKALTDTNDLLEDNDKLVQEKLKAEKKLAKQEKELIKLRKKLNDELKDGSAESEKLKIQIQERNKAAKEAAKDALGLIDAYTKESKVLTQLKKDLKNTTIEMRRLGKSEEEVEKATKVTRKEIHKLDKELRSLDKSVGDSYREIGKYEEALEDLKGTAGDVGDALAGIGAGVVIGVAADKLLEAAANSRQAQLEIDKTSALSKATFDVVGSNLTSGFLSLRQEAKQTRDAIDLYKKTVEDGGNEAIAKRVLENTIKQQEAQKKIREEQEASLDSDATKKQIDETTEAYKNLAKETIDASVFNNDLERDLANLILRQQELAAISDDDTRSLEENIAAKRELVKQNELVAETQALIAGNDLVVQTKSVAVSLAAKGVLTALEAENATGESINELLKNDDIARKITSEKGDAFTAAYVAAIDADAEAITTQLETQESLSKLLSDKYEKDLDILIDGADRIKSINERIIADDNVSTQRRRDLLVQTTKLMKSSFNKQVQTIRKFTTERLDLNTELTEDEKDVLKKNVSTANIKSLLEAKTAEELNEKIRLLGLSEIFEGRTLEVILERIQANQDLLEVSEDLNETLAEELNLKKKIAAQNEALNNDEELEEDANALNLEIEAAQRRVDRTKEGSVARLEAEEELNDLLLEEQARYREVVEDNDQDEYEKAKERAKKREDDEKKRLERMLALRKRVLEEGTELLDEILTRSREKRENALDEELDGLDERINTVRDAIQAGNSEAVSSLTELEKAKAEAEEKKAQLRQREIRDEKIIAGLNLLAANADNPNAVAKTASDVALLITSLDQIPGFFEGTEDTGTVANPLDNNGGRITMLHDNERVVTAAQNARMGGMSNDDLADLAQMHNAGNLGGGAAMVVQNNNKELVGKMDEVAKAIKSIPVSSYNYDANGKYHEQVIETANKKEINKYKAKNIWK